MTPTGITLLFAAVLNLLLLGFVLRRRHTRPAHFAFVFLIAIISSWTFCNFLITVTDSIAVLNVVGRLCFSLAVFIAAGYLVFTWTFPETSHPVPSPRSCILLLVSALTMAGLALTPLIQASVTVADGSKHPVYGPLYSLYVLYMVVLFCLGTINLFSSLKRTPSGRERVQVTYTLIGFIFSFILSYLAILIIPALAEVHDVYLLGVISPLPWVLISSYAIFRHRLMDIGVAVRNVMVHALLTLVIGIGLAIPLFSLPLIPKYDEPIPLGLAALAIALLYALLLPPLQKYIQHVVDHRIFRGRYDYESALVNFGSELLRAHGGEGIARMTARQVAIIMRTENTAVYLTDMEHDDYVLRGSWCRAPRCHYPDTLPRDAPLLRRLEHIPGCLLREEITYGTAAGKRPELDILEMVSALQLEVLVPFVCQERVLGFLVLGEKQNDNMYASDDLQLIQSLATQVAFALDNARLYEQIIASSRQYETILGHIRRAVLAVDVNLRITALNITGAELLQVQAGDWIGRRAEELIPTEADLLRQTIAEEKNLPRCERTMNRAGQPFPAECETSVITDARNHVSGALLVFEDLTEHKRLEEEMRRMDRLASVGTLAAGIAHEIKNPLVAIRTYAELLPQRYQDKSFREQFGGIVLDEITRINRLILNLLEFSRPMQRDTGPLDLHALVQRAETLLESKLKSRNITLVKHFDSAPAIVNGDAEQLYQVVLNVLQNAIESIPENGGTITVATRLMAKSYTNTRPDLGVEICFTDTGCGIDKADLPRIFDPFFSKRDNGSGLGLAVCHGILENHGADINVRSAPGKGTAFVFTFPVQPDR